MKSILKSFLIFKMVLLLSISINLSTVFAAKEKPVSPPASDVATAKNNQSIDAMDQELTIIEKQQKALKIN